MGVSPFRNCTALISGKTSGVATAVARRGMSGKMLGRGTTQDKTQLCLHSFHLAMESTHPNNPGTSFRTHLGNCELVSVAVPSQSASSKARTPYQRNRSE